MSDAILGKYEIIKRIATGGMAEIFLARSVGPLGVEKLVVVKQILPHLASNQEFVEMFLDEARIAATLHHPNLVQMYDVGSVGDQYFIAMEFLQGEDLRTLRKTLRDKQKSLPLEHAISIVIGVASGLEYAHERTGLDGKALNIVHRDVSPQNVIVTYDGCAKLVDFGIAKATNRLNDTRFGMLKGKIPYMSPEQCGGEPLDRRSDVYSAGILLYELTTGHKVHKSGSDFMMMRAIVDGDITPPSKLRPFYPQELEAIVLKCLEVDRSRRYQTARELQGDLEQFARERKMAISPLSLSAFMKELYSEKIERWREAIASGRDVSNLIPTNEAGGRDSDPVVGQGPRPTQPATPLASKGEGLKVGSVGGVSIPQQVAHRNGEPKLARLSLDVAAGGNRNAKLSSKELNKNVRILSDGDVQVIRLSGRLTESFQGKAIADEMGPIVVLDLGEVDRVTSFGVREWMQMLSLSEKRVSELYFYRCSEAVVNQLTLIRGFTGIGKIISFAAPYQCGACGKSFQRFFDCEFDRDVIISAKPSAEMCPHCQASTTTFDDDPRTYFAFALGHVTSGIPQHIRQALESLDKPERLEAIEKWVEGESTYVRLNRHPDATVRWNRILDGIEGELVLNFHAAPDLSSEAAAGLASALVAISGETSTIRIDGCPESLITTLANGPRPSNLVIVAATLNGQCLACGTRATAVVVGAELATKRTITSPCRSCQMPLTFAASDALAQIAGIKELANSGSLPSLRPSKTPVFRPRLSTIALVVCALGAATLMFALSRRTATSSQNSSSPNVGSIRPGSAVAASGGGGGFTETAPGWAERPFDVEQNQVFVVGKSQLSDSHDVALAGARDDAITRLVIQLRNELKGTALYELVQTLDNPEGFQSAASGTKERIAERYLHQVGTIATPERADYAMRRADGKFEAFVLYRLSRAAYGLAAQTYRGATTFEGITLAPLYPLLDAASPTEGAVVVVAVQKNARSAHTGLRVGDVIVDLNGHKLDDEAAFGRALDDMWTGVAVGNYLSFQIDDRGAKRTVRFRKSGER